MQEHADKKKLKDVVKARQQMMIAGTGLRRFRKVSDVTFIDLEPNPDPDRKTQD